MISYIANMNTAQIIQKVCKRKNILILNSQEQETDIKQFVKETKINFNLIKYLIIDLSILENSETEIVESIYNFSKLYAKTRVIILAPAYNEQDAVLTTLYDLGFYNIINEIESEKIEDSLNIALSENGIQKNDSKRFKKKEEIIQKESKFKNLIGKIDFSKIKPKKEKKKTEDIQNKVYLFSLLLESITRLVKGLFYILVFILTSMGLTTLINSELRTLAFQILGLE